MSNKKSTNNKKQIFQLSWSESDRPNEDIKVANIIDLWTALEERGVTGFWIDVYSHNNFAGKMVIDANVGGDFFWSKELLSTFHYQKSARGDLKEFLIDEVSLAFYNFFDPIDQWFMLLELGAMLVPNHNRKLYDSISKDTNARLTYIEEV